MNINRAISFIFDDQEWLKKIAIGALISLIPIVGGFVLMGWALEITRRIIKNEPETLPEFTDFGELLSKGFKVFVVQLAYFFPIILLFICGYLVSFAGMAGLGQNTDISSELLGSSAALVMVCVTCITIPLLFLSGIASQVARGRLADTGMLSQALNLREVVRITKAGLGKYLLAFLMVFLAAMILSPIGGLLCGIGALFTTALISAFDSHLVGQAYKFANPMGEDRPGTVEII